MITINLRNSLLDKDLKVTLKSKQIGVARELISAEF